MVGDASLKDVTWTSEGRSDSKLHDVMLVFAVTRHWPNVESNACSPGWAKTKIYEAEAPGNAEYVARTQICLAGTKESTGSGADWIDRTPWEYSAAGVVAKQEKVLRTCEGLTGVTFPKD